MRELIPLDQTTIAFTYCTPNTIEKHLADQRNLGWFISVYDIWFQWTKTGLLGSGMVVLEKYNRLNREDNKL